MLRNYTQFREPKRKQTTEKNQSFIRRYIKSTPRELHIVVYLSSKRADT